MLAKVGDNGTERTMTYSSFAGAALGGTSDWVERTPSDIDTLLPEQGRSHRRYPKESIEGFFPGPARCVGVGL